MGGSGVAGLKLTNTTAGLYMTLRGPQYPDQFFLVSQDSNNRCYSVLHSQGSKLSELKPGNNFSTIERCAKDLLCQP